MMFLHIGCLPTARRAVALSMTEGRTEAEQEVFGALLARLELEVARLPDPTHPAQTSVLRALARACGFHAEPGPNVVAGPSEMVSFFRIAWALADVAIAVSTVAAERNEVMSVVRFRGALDHHAKEVAWVAHDVVSARRSTMPSWRALAFPAETLMPEMDERSRRIADSIRHLWRMLDLRSVYSRGAQSTLRISYLSICRTARVNANGNEHARCET